MYLAFPNYWFKFFSKWHILIIKKSFPFAVTYWISTYRDLVMKNLQMEHPFQKVFLICKTVWIKCHLLKRLFSLKILSKDLDIFLTLDFLLISVSCLPQSLIWIFSKWHVVIIKKSFPFDVTYWILIYRDLVMKNL